MSLDELGNGKARRWATFVMKALALIAVVTMYGLMSKWWNYLYSDQYPDRDSLWPAPAGYIVEMVALTVAALAVTFRIHRKPNYNRVLWFFVGLLATVVGLGGFSIGPSVTPGATALLIAAVLGTAFVDRAIPASLAAFVAGLVVQAMLMLVVIPALG